MGEVGEPRGDRTGGALGGPASPLYREELDPHRRMIVYCASGSRAALSADTLRRMGYENVARIDGG